MSELADRVSQAVAPRYVLERQLGHGGTATVFLAQDRKLNRPVALKVLRPEIAAAVGEGRFLREVDIGANLTHPHILPILDSGEADGLLYFTMPYVDGESLHDRLRREKQLPLDEAVRITTEVASALSYAHEHGILHRDIKPGNILLEDGQAVVADFGLAKVKEARAALTITSGATTETGIAVGTPHYMSPEQWEADSHIDGRSDVYSLGCVLYEMLTGEPPFTGPDIQSVRSKACGQQAPSLQIIRGTIPRRLDTVYRRALEKIPADRYASARDFSRALERAAQPPTPFQRTVDRIAAWPRWLRVGTAVGTSGAVVGTATVIALRVIWPPPLAIDQHRVLVDLFENHTGDTRFDAWGRTAQLWLSDELERWGVRVVPFLHASRASQFVRDTSGQLLPNALGTLARQSGAGTIVTGAMEVEGTQLLIHARVVDATSGAPVGSTIPTVAVPADSIRSGIQMLGDPVVGALYVAFETRLPHLAESPAPPPDPAAYEDFDEGLRLYMANRFADAAERLQSAYAMDTTFVPALLYAALNYSNLGLWDIADSLLQIVATRRELLSRYDEYWLDYRQALVRGDRERALQVIRRASELAPGSKASYNLGVEAFETLHLEEARRVLASLDPDGPVLRGWESYWSVLTRTLHALEDYRAELQEAQRAEDGHAAHSRHVPYDLSALAAMGQTDRLLDRLDSLTANASVEDGELVLRALRETAEELQAHGLPTVAATAFERAIAWHERLPPRVQTSPSTRFERARALAGLNRWDEAAQVVRPLADSFPEELAPGGRYSIGELGVIAAHLGDTATARSASERLAAMDGRYLFGLHIAERARIAAALGGAEEATALLEDAFRAGYPFNLDLHRSREFRDLWSYPPFATLLTPRR